MKRANRLMLIAGVVLAVVAFVAVLTFANFGGQAPVQQPDVTVMVAAVDLPLGAALTADVLTTAIRSPADSAGMYQQPEDLVGRIVRRAVGVGQAFTALDFETGTGLAVAQSLRPGQRAIAVPLSRVDSVAALLQPGDWVDVILSLRDLDALNPIVAANPNYGRTTTSDGTDTQPYIPLDEYLNNTTVKVVVQNVQVMASVVATQDDTNFVTPALPQAEVVVVLSVTPQQAEIIRFAQLDGNVSLAMRAPGDYASADMPTTGITLKQLVDYYGVLPPKPVAP